MSQQSCPQAPSLFKIIESPTFNHFWSKDDAKEFREGFLQGMREAADDREKTENI